MLGKIRKVLEKVGSGNVPFPTYEPEQDGSAKYRFPTATRLVRKAAWKGFDLMSGVPLPDQVVEIKGDELDLEMYLGPSTLKNLIESESK